MLFDTISVFVFPDDSITDGFLDKYRKDHPNGVYNPVLTSENYEKYLKDGYKPILRPPSDMTEQESEEMQTQDNTYGGITQSWSYMTKYLIDKGFDCFGMIGMGLAIDKTKIK